MQEDKSSAKAAPIEQSNIEQTKAEPRGFLQDIILNAFEPGINQSVLIFLNIVFALLLATLAGVSVFTGINIHIIVLGIITIGLCVGFNLFISQLPSLGEEKSNTLNKPKED